MIDSVFEPYLRKKKKVLNIFTVSVLYKSQKSFKMFSFSLDFVPDLVK